MQNTLIPTTSINEVVEAALTQARGLVSASIGATLAPVIKFGPPCRRTLESLMTDLAAGPVPNGLVIMKINGEDREAQASAVAVLLCRNFHSQAVKRLTTLLSKMDVVIGEKSQYYGLPNWKAVFLNESAQARSLHGRGASDEDLVRAAFTQSGRDGLKELLMALRLSQTSVILSENWGLVENEQGQLVPVIQSCRRLAGLVAELTTRLPYHEELAGLAQFFAVKGG